jgi:hypothetical protein
LPQGLAISICPHAIAAQAVVSRQQLSSRRRRCRRIPSASAVAPLLTPAAVAGHCYCRLLLCCQLLLKQQLLLQLKYCCLVAALHSLPLPRIWQLGYEPKQGGSISRQDVQPQLVVLLGRCLTALVPDADCVQQGKAVPQAPL